MSDFRPDITFICVPTPMSKDSNQDISLVEGVLEKLEKLNLESLVVIKSTILPNNIKNLSGLSNNLVYNPEFLREKHADDDFINSKINSFWWQ